MSINLILPLRRKLHIEKCRDGGSIDIGFVDFWGRSYRLELSVVYEDVPEYSVKGYSSPTLTKYYSENRVSKGNGKSYKVSRQQSLELVKDKFVKLAKKFVRLASSEREKAIIQDLIFGIETGKLRKNT